jgi:hypothetical protein
MIYLQPILVEYLFEVFVKTVAPGDLIFFDKEDLNHINTGFTNFHSETELLATNDGVWLPTYGIENKIDMIGDMLVRNYLKNLRYSRYTVYGGKLLTGVLNGEKTISQLKNMFDYIVKDASDGNIEAMWLLSGDIRNVPRYFLKTSAREVFSVEDYDSNDTEKLHMQLHVFIKIQKLVFK